MAPGAKQVLQVVTHDVSGVHAWMGMVDGMNAADPAPPHMALIKRFFFGPQKLGTVGGECRAVHTRCEATDAIDQRSVVHCVEGEENLKAVNELFALDGPFLKGFFESPVMKGKEVSWDLSRDGVSVARGRGRVAQAGPPKDHRPGWRSSPLTWCFRTLRSSSSRLACAGGRPASPSHCLRSLLALRASCTGSGDRAARLHGAGP